MTTLPMPSTIRIAISGGGIAGASLLRAILPLAHIDAHIFESAPKFREAGVAFGIGTNAREALELMGTSLKACLERAGGVPMDGTIGYVAQGQQTGEQVLYIDASTTIVQRANLLRELLDGIPQHRMHASKKLVSLDRRPNDSLLLHFANGSTHECDVLIGADGVHSTVRKIILGDDPAAHARNTGDWVLMTLNPYELALRSLGSSMVDVKHATEQAWIGGGSFMMTNLLNNGETVQFSILSRDELPLVDPADETNRWSRTVTAEFLKSNFVNKGWPANLESGVREILCKEETSKAIYLWEHLPAKTYVDGPICIFGDAAHATTPYMGSGGGQCMEDTMIMSTLLARVATPAEAIKALKVYDRVRRPRTQQVVKASLRTGELITGSDKTIGIDAVPLKEALDGRWDFIWKFSNKDHKDEASRLLEAELNITA